ncbi:MAG: DUF3488 and transglutaminase-like domain-containing protein [Actinomycetes bacterium]
MRATDRMTLAITVAVLLATFTLTPLTADGGVLSLGWLLALVVGAVTLGLRRARLGSAAVLAGQLLVLLAFVGWLVATLPALGETWTARLVYLATSGVQHMQDQAAPMEPNHGVRLLFVAVVGAIAVLTDLLAAGIRRPVWALAPPAALFLVPAVGIGIDTGLVSFACVALGYLGILVAEGLNTTARWPRGLSRDSAEGFGGASPVVWRSAGYIGGLALGAAVVLGLLLPTFALPGIGIGSGSGRGGPLQLSDPTLDLRRNLNRPVDSVVMEYRSDRPGGVYLRTASLPRFSEDGWSNVEMRLEPGNELPEIPGVTDEPRERRTTTVEAYDMRSAYLPLPYAPRQFDADGEWAHDPDSLVVLSTARDSDRATEDLTYTVQSAEVNPTAEQLADVGAGTPRDAVTTAEIPEDLPQSLRDLARRVTAKADTPAARAAAIQDFLRGKEFTYSTEQLPGSGYQALANFLLTDKRGYCEQFSTAMAMMARVVDIPSRVAIGFLPGERRGDVWEVSAHDMHAWPELYFADYGWVRYEPTPATVTGSAPPWTQETAEDPGDRPSDAPNNEPSASVQAPTQAPTEAPTDPNLQTGEGSDTSALQSALWVGAGLLVLAVLAGPATVRIRRRSSRLSEVGSTAEQVESAWAEIRDTVMDYGGSWPEGSPRAIGGAIADRLEGEEASSMTAVATLVERSRYAAAPPESEVTQTLPAMTTSIRRALGAPQSFGRKMLATLLPRSLFRRRR